MTTKKPESPTPNAPTVPAARTIAETISRSAKTCNCDQWKRAQEDGTDKECYTGAVEWTKAFGRDDAKMAWHIGDPSELPPAIYCPWCGKPLPPPPNASDLASE